MIYLDSAATVLIHDDVLNSCHQFIDLYKDKSLSASAITMHLRSSLVAARESVGRLINCSSDEVALVQSTSHALSIMASVLPLGPCDNILMCDLEYQASPLSFMRQSSIKGFEIRCVNTTGGRITREDFENAVDTNTKAILLASVQEINGYRADIKEISAFAKEKGIYFIVDGIQEVGALTVDVKELDIDFYCAGGKKWLGNPFGMGFLYMKKELLNYLKPTAFNYFNIQVPAGFDDYISYLESPQRHPFDEYEFVNNASKFEIGGYANYVGAYGLTAAINLILRIGPKAIEQHIKELSSAFYSGLVDLGITPSSSGDDKHMSSIVSFNFGLKNNNIRKEKALVKYLQEHEIFVSLRCSTGTGGIRTSFHYYNTMAEVDTMLGAISQFLQKTHY